MRFPFPSVDLGITVVSELQNTRGLTLGRERAHYTVRNIPKFKDRANWSCDTFKPMRRRACVYQQTNQNIAPVIKNFQNNGWSRTEVDSVSEAILEVSREIFSTFCGLFFFYLLNNAMYRRDFGRLSR